MTVPLTHRPARRAQGTARRVLCAVVVLLCAATASAQGPLTKAKALYDAANYEEALTVLASVHEPEAQQYRALCMLALGRMQDASGEVDSLIASAPTFEPSTEDVPPRFVSLVSESKQKLLPGIARKAFNEAREQFKSGDRAAALKKFDTVVTLASTAGFRETSDAEDLRTLASGFIELAQASVPARPEPKVAVPTAEPPTVVEVAPAAGAPAPATASAPQPDVSQPVAVRQTIPAVPSGLSGLGSPTASVRVEIGTDGHVVNASMQQPSHPVYDRLVLQAARAWLYKPATLNGRPVPSEKIVTIQLR